MKMKLALGILIILLSIGISCSNEAPQEPLSPDRSSEVLTYENIVEIYSAPDTLDQANTTYILQNDVVADKTAFWIGASNIQFDLNGFSITYANAGGLGQGFKVSTWNKVDVEIFNGSVIQSVNVDPEDIALVGQTPFNFASPSIANYLHLHHLYIEYRSAQTDGIVAMWGNNHTFNDLTINDVGTVITNRHSYRGAIQVSRNNEGASAGTTNIYNNTIIRCRQGGFLLGNNTNAWNNNIIMESVATNAMAFACYERENLNIYDNIVRGTGFHCIGIGVVSGGINIEAWGNDIEVQTTLYNPEYGSTHSAAWRTTWDYYENVEVHHNRFVGYAEDGLLGGGIDSETWVVWVGLGDPGSEMYFHDNVIIADNKGTGAEAAGICVIGGNNADSNLRFENNTVESNWACVYLGNNYGGADGFALFKNNTFKKMGNAQQFYTIMEWGWDDPPSTGRFVDNTYQGQTDFEDMFFWWNGTTEASTPWCGGILSKVDIRYAWGYSLIVLNPQDNPMVGVIVEIRANDGELIYSGTTNSSGRIETYLDELTITNCDDHLPEYIELDYLAPNANKVIFNSYEITITNGVAVYTTFEIDIYDNKSQGVIITKNTGGNDPPYEIK